MIAMLGARSFFRFPFKVFHEEGVHMTNFHAEFKSMETLILTQN